MTFYEHEKRISLKKVIDQIKNIYLMQESVRLKLSLLLSLSFNGSFTSLLEKVSLSKQILIDLPPKH